MRYGGEGELGGYGANVWWRQDRSCNGQGKRENVCMLGEESEKERQRRDRGGPQSGYGFQKTNGNPNPKK